MPNTPFKFCPVCGSSKLTEINESLLKCINCQFDWYQNPKVCGLVVILNSKNEVLLARRGREPKKDMWGLVAGFYELNETLEEGLCREIEEEIGLKIEPKRLTYFTSKIDRYQYKIWNYHTVGTVFSLKITDREASEITALDDVSEVKWFTPAEVLNQEIAFEGTKEAIMNFVETHFSLNSLSQFRSRIDFIDQNILNLISQRVGMVKEIGEFKKQRNLPAYQPERWQIVLDKLEVEATCLNLDPKRIKEIWEKLHEYSLQLEGL